MPRIQVVAAHLDSRGDPTIKVDLLLEAGGCAGGGKA
jgi:hypothetical protein